MLQSSVSASGGTGGSEAVQLVRAILRERCRTNEEAREVLDRALALEIDPFDYFAHRLEISQQDILERAAEWAGIAFSPFVPQGLPRAEIASDLSVLGRVRQLRARLLDRDVLFASPGYFEVLELRKRASQFHELRGRLCLVPSAALRTELGRQSSNDLLDEARTRLDRRWPRATANRTLSTRARVSFVLAMSTLVPLVFFAPWRLQPFLMPVAILLLVVPSLARVAAAFSRPFTANERLRLLEDEELPLYSVLIPLRDEAQMIPLLRRAMQGLDYPPEKLDIKFVVEERSADTLLAAQALAEREPRFAVVSVPDAEPRTKPKALNYALPFVRGAHVVVFDAEDVPEPSQLRLAASTFAAQPEVVCLQAELLVDNAGENWLTAMFAAEYAGQFGLLLPALARWGLPLPLGGTSNHFRVEQLRQIGGWDAFNVTEDADLGVRLARKGYRTATLPSRTYEEAPIALRAWLRQRTRWMKGWMQTFLVHNRHPIQFLRQIGWPGFVGFQLYLLNVILSPLLHTILMVSLLLWAAFGIRPMMFDPWGGVSLLVLLLGYGGAVSLTFAGLRRLKLVRLLAIQLGLPVYWLLHSLATVRAAGQLLARPYFWAKTEHGKTRHARITFHRKETEQRLPQRRRAPIFAWFKAGRVP